MGSEFPHSHSGFLGTESETDIPSEEQHHVWQDEKRPEILRKNYGRGKFNFSSIK
jgi:hypothetical protein